MKRNTLTLFALVAFVKITCAQITFENTYSVTSPGQGALHLTKFSNAGYKYVLLDVSNMVVKLFNTNHSLYLTFNIPVTNTVTSFQAFAFSDNLFNLDNNIEYIVSFWAGQVSQVRIFDQNGTQIFFKDSAAANENYLYDPVSNNSTVYYNGSRFKMKLVKYDNFNNGSAESKWSIYDLPGSLPCNSCTNFTLGVGPDAIKDVSDNLAPAAFFPNPVVDQLKLKYELPPDCKNAEIKIYDLQGKNIENYTVTDTFDFLYLPSGFNNGTYLYSLVVNGQIIKNEKIILMK